MIKIGEFIQIPNGAYAGTLGQLLEIRPQKNVAFVQVGQARVEVPLDVLEKMEEMEEEAEAEGNENLRRKIGAKAAKAAKEEKRPVRQSPPKPVRPVTPPVTAVTAVTAPPAAPAPLTPGVDGKTPGVVAPVKEEKKEEKKVNNTASTQTQQGPARVEPLYCPICGNIRRRPNDLVCGDCYRDYEAAASINLARGGKFQKLFDYVADKAPAILATLEGQYTVAKNGLTELKARIGRDAYDLLKRNAGGNEVPASIWATAFQQKTQELWRINLGNVKYAKMKGLEGRIALLKGIIEKAKEPAPVPAAPAKTETASPLTLGVDGKTPSVVALTLDKDEGRGKTSDENQLAEIGEKPAPKKRAPRKAKVTAKEEGAA